MNFAAKERKNVQNQDKQTPPTVLQKLSPKPTCPPLSAFLLYTSSVYMVLVIQVLEK